MSSKNSYPRAQRLLTARACTDPTTAASVEAAIALEILGPEIIAIDASTKKTAFPQYGYMTPFETTEEFAKELHSAIATYASNLNRKPPKQYKYHPAFGVPRMVKAVWQARQLVDSLGVSYFFFVQHALMYWQKKGYKRIPTPGQLCEPDVVEHVLNLWPDPEFRFVFPLLEGWDARFDAERFIGEPQQMAALELIDQRLKDAEKLHIPAAEALGKFIDHTITVEEATTRYGAELVEQSILVRDGSDAEIDELVGPMTAVTSGISTSPPSN